MSQRDGSQPDRQDPVVPASEVGDEDDAWDKRIRKTGCFAENERLLICHADTNDWRQCARELAAFRKCMSQKSGSAPDDD
ncbi:Cytochrome oxidase assembly factor 4 [Coemansia sp. RSA 2424]|nr:Cytochrome oxidase assembly factor 4 [Coemansia sp. RSA 2424]